MENAKRFSENFRIRNAIIDYANLGEAKENSKNPGKIGFALSLKIDTTIPEFDSQSKKDWDNVLQIYKDLLAVNEVKPAMAKEKTMRPYLSHDEVIDKNGDNTPYYPEGSFKYNMYSRARMKDNQYLIDAKGDYVKSFKTSVMKGGLLVDITDKDEINSLFKSGALVAVSSQFSFNKGSGNNMGVSRTIDRVVFLKHVPEYANPLAASGDRHMSSDDLIGGMNIVDLEKNLLDNI